LTIENEPPLPLSATLLVLHTRARVSPDGKPLSWDLVAEETHHSKPTVLKVWQWFIHLDWETARALVDNSEPILKLRPDYLAKRVEEEQQARKQSQEDNAKSPLGEDQYEETPHKQDMRVLAGQLRDRISLTSVWSRFLLEFEPGQLLSSGMAIVIDQDRKVSIDLGMDEEGPNGHLWKGLRSHLETGGLAEVLDQIREWKGALAQYVKKCHPLMKVAASHTAQGCWRYDENVELNKKPGYKVSFLASACADAVEIACGKPPVTDDAGYYCEQLSNGLWLLIRYGAGGICVAESKFQAEKHRGEHQELMINLPQRQAGEVANLRPGLEQTTDRVKGQLQKFIDMERVPGHCELCNSWRG